MNMLGIDLKESVSGNSSGSGSGSNQSHENDAASDRESTSNMGMMNGTSNHGCSQGINAMASRDLQSFPRELANSRERPGTAHALGLARRLRASVDSESGGDSGASSGIGVGGVGGGRGCKGGGGGGTMAIQLELEQVRLELSRVCNERDLLKATLVQASRDKTGLMKLSQPVVSAPKKDPTRLPPAGIAALPAMPGPCQECEGSSARIRELQAQAADANRRCADLAKQIARMEIKVHNF